jgi:hypothetical protein
MILVGCDRTDDWSMTVKIYGYSFDSLKSSTQHFYEFFERALFTESLHLACIHHSFPNNKTAGWKIISIDSPIDKQIKYHEEQIKKLKEEKGKV